MYYLTQKQNGLKITHSENLLISLEIQYHTARLKEISSIIEHTHLFTFHSLLGIMPIKGHYTLVVASQIAQVTSIGPHHIFEVKKVSWVPVAPFEQHESIMYELQDQIQEMQNLFADGYYYYCKGYDLSRPYLINKIVGCSLEQTKFYSQFVWNENLLNFNTKFQTSQMQQKKFDFSHQLLRKWGVKMIQGYVKEFITEIPNNLHVRYFLISRRSNRRAGTRFYARGVDDDGYVANFVQSQQIMFFNDLIFTHLQIRGSVPVFFEQVGVNGLTSQLNILRTRPLTKKAFATHFRALQRIYQRVLCVNLLSDRKSEEKALVDFYEQMVSNEVQELLFVRYQFFDFHQQCKNDKFENAQTLIYKIRQLLLAFGFNCYNIKTKQFLSLQSGVCRTNCLDCLDRTNYVQSRIALFIIHHILHCFNDPHTRELLDQSRILEQPASTEYPLLSNFNALWAENGDSISLHYTGIGSTHTDITRTGKRTLAGTVSHKMKSLMRFYTQFTDAKKHQAINRFVGQHANRPKLGYSSEFHNSLIYSVNLNHASENKWQRIGKQIQQLNPSIIVIFLFQEQCQNWMGKLKKVLSSQDLLKKHQQIMFTVFNNFQYCYVSHIEQQENCCLALFVKESLVGHIGNVTKENLSSELASKGQVLLIKITLHNSSLIFAGINCQDYSYFLQALDQIHLKAFQINKLGIFMSSSMLHQNFRIIIGNIGSKIQLPDDKIEDFRKRIELNRRRGDKVQMAKLIGQLLDYDQHSECDKQSNKYLKNYSEGPLEFIPQNNRILFWNEQGLIVRVLGYEEMERGWLRGLMSYQIKH